MVGWDWPGILTHLGIEEAASILMAGILIYGRHHRRTNGSWAHRFAHSYRAQFVLDTLLDIAIAVVTIQVMHL